MPKVILLRHAETAEDGSLSEQGQKSANALFYELPDFAVVYASDAERTQQTARLLSRMEPTVDNRANFDPAAAACAGEIASLAANLGIDFHAALAFYEKGRLLGDIAAQAMQLNGLIDETLMGMGWEEAALVVTHDICISPAMLQRDPEWPVGTVAFMAGAIINGDGSVGGYLPFGSVNG